MEGASVQKARHEAGREQFLTVQKDVMPKQDPTNNVLFYCLFAHHALPGFLLPLMNR